MDAEKITLKELNDEIKDEYLNLQVYDFQDTFVESPKESLTDKEKKAWDIDWTIECIYKGKTMIGYAMHGMDTEGNAWLDRFMIDKRYQGKGYGRITFELLLEKLQKSYPNRKHILLSVEKHNDTAIKMYEKFGFEMTDEMDGIYPIMIETRF